MASSKHEEGWENSRQLCKPETQSRVCITFENSPNSPSVKIRLCKHGKVLYCFFKIILKNTRKSETSQPCLHTLKHTYRPIIGHIINLRYTLWLVASDSFTKFRHVPLETSRWSIVNTYQRIFKYACKIMKRFIKYFYSEVD